LFQVNFAKQTVVPFIHDNIPTCLCNTEIFNNIAMFWRL